MFVPDFSIKLFICKHLSGNFLIFGFAGREEHKNFPRNAF